MRPSFTENDRRALVVDWAAARDGGVDQETFAREHGLAARTLRRYALPVPGTVGLRQLLERAQADMLVATKSLEVLARVCAEFEDDGVPPGRGAAVEGGSEPTH